MVARGRGKKAAASEAVAAVANGDVVSQENEVGSASVGVVPPPAKKGRARGSKKEAKEETDETPPIAEKPAKVAKASRGSKKTSKGKSAAEVEEVAAEKEEKNAEVPEENDAPLIETKPAAAEKKTNSRKRKADSTEKAEEAPAPAPVTKKAPRTKTKGAKKETVDSAGVPENPAASVDPISAEAQTNGNKKSSSSRKRAAPKIEEPIADELIKKAEIDEPEEEIAPPAAKKSSKSRSSKKEPKKPSSKSKGSKKAAKEEDSPEDDILPEDEFVPEPDEDEVPPQQQPQVEQVVPVEEPPKQKKLVKSKGSRKQLKDDIPPVDEEVASIKEDENIPEKPDSEVDSVIEEEKKMKGKKSTKKASTKKATAKKTAKAKKATKDEPEPQVEDENDQLDTDIEPPEGKTNGNAKPKAEPVEKKTARGGGGGGRKRAAATPDANETDGSKSAKQEVLLNPTLTEYKGSDFSLDKDFTLKISSWNIAGLRSWLKKDGLQYLQYEQPDIFCLQEIKCTTDQLPEEARIPGYHPYWLCMPGGHAGVSVYSKIMPINVEYGIGNAEHDVTGRMITAEYEKFYLICVYVPNSGMKLVNLDKRMQWEELFRAYVQRLEKIKPVIIAGDMNVSHKEIDLANPKTNTKNAGFTPQERDAMTKLLELGYVDTFRHLHPEEIGAYSFWSYRGKARSKNVGWRLDYFIVSERITPKIVESTVRAQVLGSDHCPITLFLNI